jgi:hypothetical protein
MPIGIPGIDPIVKGIPFIIAINIREMRILEGRFEINPPILLPSFSAKRVANAIQEPARKKELINRI